MAKKQNKQAITERKPFVIPQLPKGIISIKKKKDEFNPTQFVSPMFGKSVMDKTVVLGFESDGDIKKKYNAFRDEKMPVDGEEDYAEFESVLISNKTRQELFPGALEVSSNEEKTEPIIEPIPEIKLSIVKDIDGGIYKKKTAEPDFTAPVYKIPVEEEKINVTPVKEESPIFNYGNDSFSDVSFDKFSFPKYEEPVYTHQRVIETDNFDSKPIIDHFKNVEPVEEEITYKEEIEFKTPSYDEETEFIRSGDFSVSMEEEKEEVVEELEEYVHSERTDKYENYHLPPISLLRKNSFDKNDCPEWIQEQIDIINSTLIQFDIDGEVTAFTKGPTVTRYEIKLKPGVHVKKISNISDNIKMALAAKVIRIETPIPGKPNVGIEVPNKVPDTVCFGNVVDTDEFLNTAAPLKVAVGLNIDGDCVYNDIAKMPHGLIGGTTGSGKSVCINTLIVSLLFKNTPKDLKLMLIDPKIVELGIYNDIPHLITPVINDPKMASAGLKWCVDEMERRYQLLAQYRTKDIKSYNEKVLANPGTDKMPYIVVVIDELADLMAVASSDVEDSIARLTQKSRAAGIHLLVATQRPTTNVIKGTIKANIPTHFAFRVSSIADSVTILDQMGAESLLGQGDMLIKGTDNPYRVQGAYLSSEEIENVTDFIRNQSAPDFLFEHTALLNQDQDTGGDSLFLQAARFVVLQGTTSINRIQKEYNIGFNRAQRIFEMLKDRGIIASVSNGAKGNLALLTPRELDEMFGKE